MRGQAHWRSYKLRNQFFLLWSISHLFTIIASGVNLQNISLCRMDGIECQNMGTSCKICKRLKLFCRCQQFALMSITQKSWASAVVLYYPAWSAFLLNRRQYHYWHPILSILHRLVPMRYSIWGITDRYHSTEWKTRSMNPSANKQNKE